MDSGIAPVLRQMQGEGMSLHQMAAQLTAKGIGTARGGAWSATAVRNVLARAK